MIVNNTNTNVTLLWYGFTGVHIIRHAILQSVIHYPYLIGNFIKL